MTNKTLTLPDGNAPTTFYVEDDKLAINVFFKETGWRSKFTMTAEEAMRLSHFLSSVVTTKVVPSFRDTY